MNDSVLILIKEKYERLTKIQKKLADYICDNIHTIPFLSIKELGEKSDVSLASITRFTRELGFSGYADFQRSTADLIRKDMVPMKELKGSISSEETEDVLSSIARNNIEVLKSLEDKELKRNFEEAVALMTDCRKLYIAASRSSYTVGYYLYFMLKQFMEHVELLSEGTSDISNRLQYVKKEDVLIAISYSRYTKSTYDMTHYFHNMGSSIIALTDSYHSPIALKASKILLARQAPGTYSFVAAMTVANALVTAAGKLNKDDTMKQLEKQDEIAIGYGIYL